MHSNQPSFPRKPMLPFGDPMGYCLQNAHIPPLFDELVAPTVNPYTPFRNVDLRPSDACPINIIFDQTSNRSQIMLHPEMTSKMLYPCFGVKRVETAIFQHNIDPKDANKEKEVASQVREDEDSDDIDALMSTEYEEDEESGDEVSTARTNAIYNCSSPDSCSNYESLSKKSRLLFKNSYGSHDKDKKRYRVRKMVKALRGIVPGSNRMSTVAVLDEAVRYLKSLRVEVKKLGVGNLNE